MTMVAEDVEAAGAAMDAPNCTSMTSMSPTLIAIFQLRNGKSCGGRGGRGNTDNQSTTSTTNQTTSAVSATDDNNNNNNVNDAYVVSEITERGSQNGRSFGRGAYNNNNNNNSSVTFENLSQKWNIGLETAKRTIQVTTQQGVRTAVHPLHRRYRVDHLHLNRRRLNLNWFTDALFSKVISLQGNRCAQVFH